MVVRQTKEYHKSGSDQDVGENLNVNHLFVGGVTGVVDTSVLEVKTRIIKSLKILSNCDKNVMESFLLCNRIQRHLASLAAFVKLRFKPNLLTRNSI